MSGSIVQSAYNKDDTGTNGTTIAASLTGIAAGNTIVVHVGWQDSGAITCTVSDGSSYSVADAKRRDSVQGQSGEVFYFENSGGGNKTVTATFSTTTGFRRIRIYEITGIVTSSVLDQSAGQAQTGPGTTSDAVTSGNTATTTNAADYLMGFSQDTSELDPGTGTVTAGTNYTIGTTNIIMSVESRSVAATGAYAATFTQSVNNDRITHVVAFKESVPPTITLEQEGYRWRADDGDEVGASYAAAQDTTISVAFSVNRRLRTIVNATNNPPSNRYLLQYRKQGGDGIWRGLRGPGMARIPVTSYSTNFALSENPINENNFWINGLLDGLDWGNIRTLNGHAFAAITQTGFNDAVAHLSPSIHQIPADHQVIVTIHRVVGYTAPDSHEVFMMLRAVISAHSARGYECQIPISGGGQIVRWNGASGDFTILSTSGPGASAPVEGDIFKSKIIGSNISIYQNNTLIITATDSTFTNGNPGFGNFVRTGGTPESYCIKGFSASVAT
jgi:hypothetical protein